MIKIDDRKSSFPYSDQCRKCRNLISENKQKCGIYGLKIPDEYWKALKKCPNYRAA